MDGLGEEEGLGGDLEAAIEASRQRAEAKSTRELQLELEALRMRLLRRSQTMDAMRKAYVQDVVVIKNELSRKATMTDEQYYAEGGPGTEITDAVPSLDMRPVLALFSPEDAFLRSESCDGCGGHLEIVTRETKHVARLNKRISALTAQTEEAGKNNAQMKAELLLTRQRVKELDERNTVNRDTLVAKLSRTQTSCEADILALKEGAIRSEQSWTAKLAQKEEQLEVVPILMREGEMLRTTLAEEVAGREDDLHLKDGEIAMLKAQVEDLESAADAASLVLTEVREKGDEIQRRVKAEKADHSITKGLLDEERARYERCRASLETSQEHFADLDQRFNEMRAEVEAAAENAEDEASEAGEALAAAKAEIRRLRAVLGTNDTAGALEASVLKVASLSEELHAVRAEAREANDALREAQDEAQNLKHEVENLKAVGTTMEGGSFRSERMSSLESSGSLSWHGSLANVYEEGNDDDGERDDRMSSAMTPGGIRFEKGKWAVEKWLGLVRFRKAVNAHSAEMSRLQGLLHEAKGEQDRTLITDKLQRMSGRGSLADMEDALHKEVAALRNKAITQSSEERREGDEQEVISAARDEMWSKMKANIAEMTAAKKAQDKETESLQMVHKAAVELLSNEQRKNVLAQIRIQALQEQVAKCQEEIASRDEEAEEMRDKLKKLAKLEKNQKGHDAMTEELEKMAEETGISVGFDQSLEFTSMEGDLSKEDEGRLIEELANARDEIKNIKMRQAMVTHELLGNIKGAKAEIEMLRVELDKVTAERDERVDLKTLGNVGTALSSDEKEELQSLKEDMKRQKKANASLKEDVRVTSEALRTVLQRLSMACTQTRRAKAKVWNIKDLERARSIPPRSTAINIPSERRVSHAVKRLSAIGAMRRKQSGMGLNGSLPVRRGEGEGVPSMGMTDEAPVGDDDSAANGREAELERRREERAAAALAKKAQAEADEQELNGLEEALESSPAEGVEFATDRLHNAETTVKDQFKEVFQELRDALEAHKKFVLRSRVEARDSVAQVASLQAEEKRLLAILKAAEEELHGTSAILKQTESYLHEEKDTAAGLRLALEAVQAEANENLYFKEKNAVLQKDVDDASISRSRAKQECAKAKWELQDQASSLHELKNIAEEKAKVEEKFEEVEGRYQSEIAGLTAMMEESQQKLDEIERQRRAGLEALTSTSSQVSGYGDPQLGLGRSASTQTNFHYPALTLRRSNGRDVFPARSSSARPASNRGHSSSKDTRGWGLVCSDPGVVRPAVDGTAWAADRRTHSSGPESPVLLNTTRKFCVSRIRSAGGNEENASHPSCPFFPHPKSFSRGHVPFESHDYEMKSASPSATAESWGLWHNGFAPEGNSKPGTQIGDNSARATDVENSISAGDGSKDEVGEKLETKRCRTGNVRTFDNTRQSERSASREEVPQKTYRRRPQTSPPHSLTNPELGENPGKTSFDDSLRKEDPWIMHDRVPFQSAMNLSLPSDEWACAGGEATSKPNDSGGNTNVDGHIAGTVRATVGSRGWTEEERHPTDAANSSVPGRIATEILSSAGRGMQTSPKENSRNRSGGATVVPCSSQGRIDRPATAPVKAGIGYKELPSRRVIDAGVKSGLPRARVWGDRQMAAAAAAAMGGRCASLNRIRGCMISKGGVALDARLANVRQILRSDAVDTAERIGLPLLQT